jgi:hypothetical protein
MKGFSFLSRKTIVREESEAAFFELPHSLSVQHVLPVQARTALLLLDYL